MINLLEIATNITSPYGQRTDPITGKPNATHAGIDLVLKDPNIPFVLGGTVISSGYHAKKGNYVTLEQSDGTVATYMHMKHLPTWKKGDEVEEGQTVGIMGSTGNSTGTHLHYEVQAPVNGELQYIDPDAYFRNYATGDADYITDSMTEIPENGGNGYSILGNIVRFIILLLVGIVAAYLILKAFDINIL